MSPQRRLRLNLRRSIKRVQRRFDVRDLDDGRVEVTCKTCGKVTIERPGDEHDEGGGHISDEAARFLAGWWTANKVISGNCEVCLKNERDRRFPLEGT